MRGFIILLLSFVILVAISYLAIASGFESMTGSTTGSMTGFLEVSGKGNTEIVETAMDRHTGFSRTEVLYSQGAIDYSAMGFVNDSTGISQRNRTIDFPKGLFVNVQHLESSFVFNGTGMDLSNINVASSYMGFDRVAQTPNCTIFDLKSEFDGTWDVGAFKNEIAKKIDSRTALDGKFEVEKEIRFSQFD